eukprot:4993403-Prymnesium_polylepis.1
MHTRQRRTEAHRNCLVASEQERPGPAPCRGACSVKRHHVRHLAPQLCPTGAHSPTTRHSDGVAAATATRHQLAASLRSCASKPSKPSKPSSTWKRRASPNHDARPSRRRSPLPRRHRSHLPRRAAHLCPASTAHICPAAALTWTQRICRRRSATAAARRACSPWRGASCLRLRR